MNLVSCIPGWLKLCLKMPPPIDAHVLVLATVPILEAANPQLKVDTPSNSVGYQLAQHHWPDIDRGTEIRAPPGRIEPSYQSEPRTGM